MGYMTRSGLGEGEDCRGVHRAFTRGWGRSNDLLSGVSARLGYAPPITTTSSPLGESLSYTHCSLLPGSLPLRVRGYAIHPAVASCCSAKVLCVLAVGGSDGDGSVPLLVASSWNS